MPPTTEGDYVVEEPIPAETIVEEGPIYQQSPMLEPDAEVWNPFQAPSACATCGGPYFYSGVDFVLVKPHFDDGVAIVRDRTDNTTFQTTSELGFDYDVEFSPRIFLGYVWESGLGARIRYWTFDHESNPLTASPDADGLGSVSSPISLDGTMVPSTSVPTDSLLTSSDLRVDTIDVEMTKGVHFDHWALMIAGGVRYARVDQSYLAEVRSNQGVLLADIRFDHGFDGVGPTVALQARRPLFGRFKFFSSGRISALFGNGKSTLVANDNPAFLTNRSSSRDDLLTVGELAVGLEWARNWYGYGLFFRAALEGQTWQGAGTPTSEEGDLGFLGTSITVGLDF